MSVSDALEFDLPVKDGPAGPESDETIYCDLSMLPEELGQRVGGALASMAAALRGDDSKFPWGEPDPVGVGIALQVLSFLPREDQGRKRSLYRIAFHEVSPDAEEAGERPPAPDRSDPAALPGVAVGDDRRPAKRFLNTREAGDYVGLSAKTLARWRVAGGGPRYIKRSNRVVYEVVDLDAWMEEENAGIRQRRWKNEAARPPMRAGGASAVNWANL